MVGIRPDVDIRDRKVIKYQVIQSSINCGEQGSELRRSDAPSAGVSVIMRVICRPRTLRTCVVHVNVFVDTVRIGRYLYLVVSPLCMT